MKSRPPTEKKNAKKKNATQRFACRVSTPRLGHEMAYNAGREVSIPPLNPYNIIKAKRGEVSQSMDLYCGFHRGEVFHKLSRSVSINGPLLWISSGRGFPQAVPKSPDEWTFIVDFIGARFPTGCPEENPDEWTFIVDFIGAKFPTSCPEESRSMDRTWTGCQEITPVRPSGPKVMPDLGLRCLGA